MSLSSFYRDKVVIVTGASMGIGKELARQLLQLGAKVAITGRTLSKLVAVKEEFKVAEDRLIIHAGDAGDQRTNEELVARCLRSFGRIDILVNNAGLSAFGPLDKMKLEVYKKVIDTNIYGSIVPTMVCFNALKQSKGSVLFVSSIAGLTGLPGYSAYSMSKMALKSLAHALRIEFHNYNIAVGISYIGFTENEPHKKTFTPDGKLTTIPDRPSFLTFTREKTARKMLVQIAKRKYSVNQSFLGKLVMFLSKVLPATMLWIMRSRYKHQT